MNLHCLIDIVLSEDSAIGKDKFVKDVLVKEAWTPVGNSKRIEVLPSAALCKFLKLESVTTNEEPTQLTNVFKVAS